jgi:hypothetical protein
MLLGVFGIPTYRIYKGSNLLSNIVLCWALAVLWAVTWCIVLPAIFLPFSKEIYLLFPEAIGIPVILFLGWIPITLYCSVAYVIIIIIKKIRKSQTPNKSL